jgi:hypothetical protein
MSGKYPALSMNKNTLPPSSNSPPPHQSILPIRTRGSSQRRRATSARQQIDAGPIGKHTSHLKFACVHAQFIVAQTVKAGYFTLGD